MGGTVAQTPRGVKAKDGHALATASVTATMAAAHVSCREVAMSAASADRNLLFGILAVQLDFVTRDALVAGMGAWLFDKGRLLADHLHDLGHLSAGRRQLLDALVDEHIRQHDGDPQMSLAALSAIEPELHQSLAAVADADVQGTLKQVRVATSMDQRPTGTLVYTGSGGPSDVRYRILRPHARGGLGEVFVAEDTELGRPVALKEIQGTYAHDAEARGRFVLEAEVTGGLEHPGIVPVYGLGTYGDGRPYYAMRFIQGDNLKDAIKRFHSAMPRFDSLEFRQLLRRFVDVCNAIAYAHSRGVLHRDLKPGNVMLGQYGETLVVDWGLAKVTGRSDGSRTVGDTTLRPRSAGDSSATVAGQAMGTPAYMPPEQADGRLDLLGPASDVYSLGATLYELLTGQIAFAGRTVTETLDAVRHGRFPPPRTVRPAAPPALDAVCLRAMAREPADRYSSAQALAADVERWLADEPVTAYAEPLGVRLRRWVRRHARLVTGGVAALGVGAIALGLVAWQREQARQAVAAEKERTARERDAKEDEGKKAADERDRAVAARQQTREALDAMVSGATGDSLATQAAISPEQRKFLEGVLTYYERFAAEPGEDRGGRERLAKAHLSLAMIHHRLGHDGPGAEVFRRAAGLWGQLAAEYPVEPAYRKELATSQNALGLAYFGLKNAAKSEESYRAAIDSWQKLATDAPAEPTYGRGLAGTYNNLGWLLDNVGRLADAEALYRKSLAIQDALAARFPAEPAYRRESARTNNNLGITLRDLGRNAEAERCYRTALAAQERLTVEVPTDPAYRQEAARTQNNLGLFLAGLERNEEARAAYADALATREKLATDFPLIPAYRHEWSRTYNNLSVVLERLGKPAEAEATYRAALTVQDKLVADFPDNPDYRQYMALTRTNLGNLLVRQGKHKEAEAAYRAALAVREKLASDLPAVPDYVSKLGAGHNQLGLLLAELDRSAEAEAAYRAALAIHGKLAADFPKVPGHRQELAIAHGNLGVLLAKRSNAKGAEAAYRGELALWEKLAADAPTAVAYKAGLARSRERLADLLWQLADTPAGPSP
ncbi:MAG: serine/threonine-protein kinase [Gemmataceae bacterium]